MPWVGLRRLWCRGHRNPIELSTNAFVDHAFRRTYGTLVATLCRRFGTSRLESIEDAVQDALARALELWPSQGVPENQAAWLFRVATNMLIDGMRRDEGRRRILASEAHHASLEPFARVEWDDTQRDDDTLRLLFICCDESIPVPSQLVFALKTLCGFDVSEIAQRLFTTDANVYKRLARARQRLSTLPIETGALINSQYATRVPAVRHVLYIMFTEGYLSTSVAHPLRRELCDEAIRLSALLATHAVGDNPETHALLALMHLHLARWSSRVESSGALLLLQEQDRTQWDARHIEVGMLWLAQSAMGTVYSRYHAEAAVAAEHCRARCMADTDWERVALAYAMLDQMAPSPLHRLNHALAIAEWQGPDAALQLLERDVPPEWLQQSYMWSAALSDLHRRAGHLEIAAHHRLSALLRAPSAPIRALLERRLGRAE